ncbi:hypothetical protein [Malikia spinosa]|uniref:hypothetical protein n=1 Tax=Malikia spinosa TaxID=86180 RepID=UPI0026BEB77C
MANWFKEEIDDVGGRLEKAIKQASEELHAQRRLTSVELKDLIEFASQKFGEAVDSRIEKAKHEASDLITVKLNEFKSQLTDAAEQQKKATLRNVTVGVCGAVIVSVVSLITKSDGQNGISAIDFYRATMAAIAGGYIFSTAFKFVKKFLESPEMKKNSVIAGAAYIDLLKPKALGPHFVIFVAAIIGWVILNETDLIISLLSRIK